MRCFLAVDVPEELRKKFMDVQRTFSGVCRAKFVEPENLHITLKFFGDVDEDKVKEIIEEIAKFNDETPVKVRFTRIGGFPSNTYVKVLWIGVAGLEELQEKLSKAAESLGFPTKRKEKPHLTIGRVKSVSSKKDFLEKMDQKGPFGEMTVKNIKLKKSDLTKQGPVYEDLKVFELGG